MPDITYVWDPIEDNVIRERDENGNTIVNYTTEPTRYGAVLSQDRGGQVRHYHYDGQGNTVSLTDDSGNVTDTRKYSAFGEVTESTGTTEFALQWNGRWGYRYDHQFSSVIRQRVFGSDNARWNTIDPSGNASGESNLYLYVLNSPITNVDPSGLITYADATCAVTARYRQGGQRWCTFTCECTLGFSAGFLPLTYNRACDHPPAIKCFRLDGWDVVCVVLAVGVSCLDSPAPGPADAGGAVILGCRGLEGLAKYAW